MPDEDHANPQNRRPADDDRAVGCDGPPPAALLAGIEQFNRGQYWDQHETLEALWMEEEGSLRYLYQGILQIGVAFHHWGRGNYRGADALLGRGLTHLQAFRPACLGIDVERLVMESAACHAKLLRLGPRRMLQFEAERLPRIKLSSPQNGS